MKTEKTGNKQIAVDYKHESDMNIDQYDVMSQEQENVFKSSMDNKRRPTQMTNFVKEGESDMV